MKIYTQFDPQFPLLPADSELTDWQICVKNAVKEVDGRAMRYKRGPWGGSTEDIYWGGKRILRKGEGSYCVGCTYEIFLMALREFAGEPIDYDGELLETLSAKEAWEIGRAFYFAYRDTEIDGMKTEELGAMGLFKWMANRPERFGWLNPQTSFNPREIQFGDAISMQYSPDVSDGHSVLAVGLDSYGGNDVVNVYGSTTYYDKKWMKAKGVQNKHTTGNGFDYYRLDVTKNGYQRKFFVSRFAPEN